MPATAVCDVRPQPLKFSNSDVATRVVAPQDKPAAPLLQVFQRTSDHADFLRLCAEFGPKKKTTFTLLRQAAFA